MDELLRRISDDIRQNVASVQSVILFGSHAQGEAHTDSDVDVLVLRDAPDAADLDVCHQILDDHTVEITLETGDRFEREVNEGHPFALSILRYGIPLYDTGVFRKLSQRRDRAPNVKWVKQYLSHAREELSRGRLSQAGTYAFNAYLLANGELNLSYKPGTLARRTKSFDTYRDSVEQVIAKVEDIVSGRAIPDRHV